MVNEVRWQIYIVSLLATLISAAPTNAAEYRAEEVAAIDGAVRCIWARTEYLVFDSTGPCDTFEGPSRIAIGETFKANGESKVINYILANQAEKDFDWGDMHIKQGQWTCTAAETAEELDFDDNDRKGVWLYIPQCKPIK